MFLLVLLGYSSGASSRASADGPMDNECAVRGKRHVISPGLMVVSNESFPLQDTARREHARWLVCAARSPGLPHRLKLASASRASPQDGPNSPRPKLPSPVPSHKLDRLEFPRRNNARHRLDHGALARSIAGKTWGKLGNSRVFPTTDITMLQFTAFLKSPEVVGATH